MDGKELRIVYMGTPDFAVEPLRRLVEEGYNVVAVVTTPDKPAGRGLKLQESAVKRYAMEAGLPVLQPEKLKDPAFVEQFSALGADLGIVIAFRMLPEVIWAQPRLGIFNLHASLLPQYRGAAPINWAVINGEIRSGVTTFLLNHEIDKGDILGRAEVEIAGSDTAGVLHDKLMWAGTDLVVETVEKIATGNVVPLAQPQSDKDLKPAPKIFKEDCLIRWSDSVEHIYNLIRGLSPYPAAWSYLFRRDGEAPCVVAATNESGETERHDCKPASGSAGEPQTVKIFAARKELAGHGRHFGEVDSDGKTYIKVACADGYIVVDELQLSGKKRMKTDEFLRGFNMLNYSFN